MNERYRPNNFERLAQGSQARADRITALNPVTPSVDARVSRNKLYERAGTLATVSLTLAMLASYTRADAANSGQTLGDVDCNGSANSIDAALILQKTARLINTLACEDAGDVNNDGLLNAVDAALILQKDAGLIDEFPAEKEPTETNTPTRTATRTPTRTPTETPTVMPTPEPAVLLETIDTGIPNLSVQKYAAEFIKLSEKQISESLREYINDVMSGEIIISDGQRCGNSFITSAVRVTLNTENIYFVRENGNIFHFNVDYDRATILNNTVAEWDALYPGQLSCNDFIIYRVFDFYGGGGIPRRFEATIFADVNNGTKTVIKDSELNRIDSSLEADGTKLLINFTTYDTDQKRGVYLLDLTNNWQSIYHIEQSPDVRLEHVWANEDATVLYRNSVLMGRYRDERVGYLIDVTTGETMQLDWPNRLTVYEHTALSRNLEYISRKLGMFSAGGVVEGQWGMLIYAPSGYFQISSPNRSFHAARIDNDGTIYTRRGEVFRFENGTYVLSETSDGSPLDVDVVRIE